METEITLSAEDCKNIADLNTAEARTNLIELTVIVKDSERTYRHNFLIYEIIELSVDDKVIKKCVEEAINIFNGTPESVIVKTKMEV